uniref:C2H2-type domain-containing protein n=1 Tax=Petromyzon marinus TaxID=7757 RepID=S4RQZ9_PETMA
VYHSANRPYPCAVCGKRFLTSYKAWTHRRTQHAATLGGGLEESSEEANSRVFLVIPPFVSGALDGQAEPDAGDRLGDRGADGVEEGRAPLGLGRRARAERGCGYICGECGKSFPFYCRFREHTKTHMLERPYICSVCPKVRKHAVRRGPRSGRAGSPGAPRLTPRTKITDEDSAAEQSDKEPVPCRLCDLVLWSADERKEHEVTCGQQRLMCRACGRTFRTAFSLWRHRLEVHHDSETFAFLPESPAAEPLSSPEAAAEREESAGAAEAVSEAVSDADNSLQSDIPAETDSDKEAKAVSEILIVLGPALKDDPKTNEMLSAEEESQVESAIPSFASPESESPADTCTKCGVVFSLFQQLERHQELFCEVKAFQCHDCNKSFRTNFRLWSHRQS